MYAQDEHERPFKKQQLVGAALGNGDAGAALGNGDAGAALLFSDAAKFDTFVEIQRTTRYQINALIFSMPAAVVQLRHAEVDARGLDDDNMLRALRARKEAVEAHIIGNDVKIQQSMLQLYRVMSRRKIAVINGQPLPPLNSVFS